MKPAVCMVCGRSAAAEPAGNKGDWVRFADYEFASFGHPAGLEYACHEHVAAAKAAASKSAAEAQAELRAHFGAPPPVSSNQPERTSWWQRLFRRQSHKGL